MEKLAQALITAVFFGLTVFIIKRDLARLSAKVDELSERQRLCRESLYKELVLSSFCREHRAEADDRIANIFERIKDVEERASRLNGIMAAEKRGPS